MYLHNQNEVSRSRISQVRAQTGQTDTHRQTQSNAGGNQHSNEEKLNSEAPLDVTQNMTYNVTS